MVLIAYLIGSIPFSYILGKWFKGVDIRRHGSGNLGATNAFRVFGKIIGTLVLVMDTCKGGIVVALLLYTDLFSGIELFHPLIYGLAAVIGHLFPVWLGFRGGKGVASSFGMLLAYQPLIALIILPLFFLIEFLTRYVSVASTTAAIATLIYAFVQVLASNSDWPLLYITLISVVLIIWKHRSNYARIKLKTENRVAMFDRFDRWRAERKSRGQKPSQH